MPHGAVLLSRWFDGRSPRPHAVRLRVQDGLLVLEPLDALVAGEAHRYPIAQVRWPERRTHGQRQTELPDGSLLQHTDAAEWDAWWAGLGLRESIVVGWMQSWRGVLLALLATAAVLAATWWWVVPWASERIAQAVPPALEQRIGAEGLAQLERVFFLPSALPQTERQALQARWQAMVARAHPAGDAPPHTLLWRRSPGLGANALALPGGQIVVTDELVVLLRDRPEVLMGVLAHELGHVRHRDGLDMLVRSTMTGALASVVLGDISGFVAAMPVVLLTQAYSRAAERRADARAAELLHRNGVSPAVMATLFERLRRPGPDRKASPAVPIAVGSHPDDEDRVRFFRGWTPARCEASIGCIRCSSGLGLRDWKSPNTQSTQDAQPDEHP